MQVQALARQPLAIRGNEQIGRFGLIREIARGGMGQVFLARDTKLGRKVALKFLLEDDPNIVSRFVIEARATARCTHENIVTIYEVGEHEGLPFMVLEYLEGKTLSQLCEQKLSPRALVELLVPVARALERAHEHGIVHRDLKPSNIFVTDRGVVKVLDFGVAKCFDATAGETERLDAAVPLDGSTRQMGIADEHTYITFSANGSLVGTLPYMSPEQWGVDVVDHLSDIWAIGIMFWRALVKQHPAGSMSPDKLRERLTDLRTPLPSIGRHDPSIPADIVAIADRCLAKPKGQRYQSATELLLDLQAALADKGPVAARVEECPYRGLAAFGEDDMRFFFGRSSEIRGALAQLEDWPLLAVIGPSGVGKSSFVHAGLVPAIKAAGAAAGRPWQVKVVRPGRAPLASLAEVLVRCGLHPNAARGVVASLPESPGQFGEALRHVAASTQTRVLVVVDQLEELFTLCGDETARELFLGSLLSAADDSSAPVRVVLAMRADFLDRLAVHKRFLAELTRGLFFLSAPDREHLWETVVRPAELAGYAFEHPSIVEDMMASAPGETSRGALPLLQFAATRLWDMRDPQRKLLTRAAYDAMGGVGGAFARHADEVAASVAPQHQMLLRAIVTRLVTPEGTRAVVDRAELVGLSGDGEVERILDLLVRGRLVHVHGQTVEIVHEVLIGEWPTLVGWLEQGSAVRGFMHELRQATRQWIARGRAGDLVWRGAPAQEAIAIAHRHVLELSSDERAFLAAVRSQAASGRRRRVAVVVAVIGALSLVIAGGSVAFVRIAAAEDDAQEKAYAAAAEATKAHAAEAAAKQALSAVKAEQDGRLAAEQQRSAAETAATQAQAQVQAVESMSQEQLKAKNKELSGLLETAQRERAKQQELAKAAADSAAVAKKATEQAERLLAAEKERVKALEHERQKIATGGLK